MGIAMRLATTGGPDVLQVTPIDEVEPGTGEVWIDQHAIGVNYLDVTQRNGAVPIPLPSGLGLEGADRVAAIGVGVTNVAVGDRVAYALGPIGSYATGWLYPAQRLVRLPEAIGAEQAAAVLFKGITAHYLLHSTYPVGPGSVALLYGAAGALGQIMVPWAKSLGTFVIGVVSKEASVERAKTADCDAVLVWGACDIASEVARITDGQKAYVVYDGIGKTTFVASLNSLRPRGMMVSFGASSGTPDPLSVGTLNAKGSLFLTRPGLAAHASDIDEYRQRAEAVFSAVAAGTIRPDVENVFTLAEAAAAHAAIEGGKLAGAILLRP